MRPLALPFGASCLALALLCGACSDAGPVTAPRGIENATSTPGTPGGPQFLASMADAPERVAHGGLRRVEYHLEIDGHATHLAYDERVTADGFGRYAIETVSIGAPAMTLAQREVFEELQRARQGFFFKYRDLRVRDLERFLQNYAVAVVVEPATIAGVACTEIEVTPRHGTHRSYRLAVDAATGLVLRSIERNAQGLVTATSTFLEFTRDPQLDGVAFHVELFPSAPGLGQLALPGGPVARPQVLPVGYREVSSDVVELAGQTFVRRVYGDGLEHVFFVERRAPPTPDAPIQATRANVSVRVAQVGSLRVAEAVHARSSYFVIGKVPEAEILAVLRSAL